MRGNKLDILKKLVAVTTIQPTIQDFKHYISIQGVVKTDNYDRLTASFKVTPSFLDDNLKVDTNAKFTSYPNS